jgi:hypothetical protein
MARRNAPQRLSKRRGVTAKETYRYGTPNLDVTANPKDTYQHTTAAGSSAMKLAEALKSGRSLLEGYAEFREQQEKEEKTKGYELGITGQDLPEDASQAKIQGYLRAEGEAEVYDFQEQVSNYLANKNHLSPEEFQEGLNQLQEQFISDKSTEYLKGFIPKARQIESHVYQDYMEIQRERVRQEGAANLAKTWRNEAEEMLRQKQAPTGIGTSEQRITKDESKHLREVLTRLQKQGKEFGLTKMEVSEHIIDVAGRLAEQTANPDFLDFATRKDKDGGIRLTDTKLVNRVRTWQRRAVAASDAKLNNQQERMKLYRKKAAEQLDRDITVALSNIDRLQDEDDISSETVVDQLLHIRSQVVNKWNDTANNEYQIALDANEIDAHLQQIDDMLETTGFAEVSNPDIRVDIKNAILNLDDPGNFYQVQNLLHNNKQDLTPNHYVQLSNLLTKERNRLEDREIKNIKQYKNEQWRFLQDELSSTGGGLIAIGGGDGARKRADAKRLRYAHQRLNAEYQQLMEETDGAPMFKQVNEILQQVKKDAKEAYPMPKNQEFDFNMGHNSNNGSDEPIVNTPSRSANPISRGAAASQKSGNQSNQETSNTAGGNKTSVEDPTRQRLMNLPGYKE